MTKKISKPGPRFVSMGFYNLTVRVPEGWDDDAVVLFAKAYQEEQSTNGSFSDWTVCKRRNGLEGYVDVILQQVPGS